MVLKAVSPERSQALRDAAEAALSRAVSRALRTFLTDVREATLAGLAASPSTAPVTASATSPLPEPIPALPPEVPPLGMVAGRWAWAVDEHITDEVHRQFAKVYSAYSSKGITMTSPALEGMETFTAAARDRLVRGTYFGVTVYEDSYNAVRIALARSIGEGWTRDELANRIAASLSWETDGAYWRGVKSHTDAQIDAVLDALGPPGTPAREWARLNDPGVQLLRDDRNLAIRHLDAERSIWQTRSTLIARTEATGASNYGTLQALASEGRERKVWVATFDARTRETHAEAHGQEVGLEEPFDVGGYSLDFPGDPMGPVEEVANCRCSMVDSVAAEDLYEMPSSEDAGEPSETDV